MTGAETYPGSRSVAGWWRQLSPLHPRELWFGHLLLHRVEALVRVRHSQRPDPLALFVLDAVSLRPGQSREELDRRLHLGSQVLGRVLEHLRSGALVCKDDIGRWSATTSGVEVARVREQVTSRPQRRSFYFLQANQAERPPRFVSLRNPPTTPWPADEGWAFRPEALQDCLSRSADWKNGVGFPTDVEAVLDRGDEAAQPVGAGQSLNGTAKSIEPWQRVIVDHPETLPVALVVTEAGPDQTRLVGFAAAPKSAAALAAKPVLELGSEWSEWFPELAQPVSLEQWHQAWLAWCRQGNLPPADAAPHAVRRSQQYLQILVPARVKDRWRAIRPELFRGEVWILAGQDRLRPAAQVMVIDQDR